jgi:hypothetical protein
MAACNTETLLARSLDGHYARGGDEAYALIREALTASGDICPRNGQLLIRLDPLTAPRRGPRHPPPSATSSTKPGPATRALISSCATRSNHPEPWLAAAQVARRPTSQTVAAVSSTDRASSQPPSTHWKGQNRLPGW